MPSLLPPHPLCDIPSGCCFCAGPSTVTRLTVFAVHNPPPSGHPQSASLRFRMREAQVPCSSVGGSFPCLAHHSFPPCPPPPPPLPPAAGPSHRRAHGPAQHSTAGLSLCRHKCEARAQRQTCEDREIRAAVGTGRARGLSPRGQRSTAREGTGDGTPECGRLQGLRALGEHASLSPLGSESGTALSAEPAAGLCRLCMRLGSVSESTVDVLRRIHKGSAEQLEKGPEKVPPPPSGGDPPAS